VTLRCGGGATLKNNNENNNWGHAQDSSISLHLCICDVVNAVGRMGVGDGVDAAAYVIGELGVQLSNSR